MKTILKGTNFKKIYISALTKKHISAGIFFQFSPALEEYSKAPPKGGIEDEQ